MDVPLELNAKVKGADGSLNPFYLKVSEPSYDEGHGFFCSIYCPFIREKEIRIFGVDEEQAIELAFEFIEKMLDHDGCKVVDEEGNIISLTNAPD